jgi:transposase
LVPVTGERKSVKIFGSVEVYSGEFIYQPDAVFNGETYVHFLEGCLARRYYRRGQPVIYIHDNAPYHREERVLEWFAANDSWLEFHCLPAYSPELNAAEPLWHHTRVHATHNRSFKDVWEILNSLERIFHSIQKRPDQILGYLRPFQ